MVVGLEVGLQADTQAGGLLGPGGARRGGLAGGTPRHERCGGGGGGGGARGPADRRPAAPGQFLLCPWAEAGMAVPAPRHTVSDTAASRRSDLEREDSGSGLDWVDCPECGLPAYVLDRFVRPSTDGP